MCGAHRVPAPAARRRRARPAHALSPTLAAPLALAVSLLAVSASALDAQIPGNVDWPVPPDQRGLVLAADAAQGLNLDSGESLYAGVRMASGRGRTAFWLGGGFAGLAGAGDNAASGGVGLSHVLGSRRDLTLAADGGLGLTRTSGSWGWAVPAGFTLWLTPAGSPALSPFVRVHGFVAKRSGYDQDVGFAAVGGAFVTIPDGPTLHVGLEWEVAGDATPLGLGAGISFAR